MNEQMPKSASVEEAMEELIKAQIEFNPEYQKLNLTPVEIHEAAMRLSNAEVGGSDKELAKKAIEAQLGARRSARVDTSEAVIDKGGNVIEIRKAA
jgi:hypothetical protein